jgi:hypothetical protein
VVVVANLYSRNLYSRKGRRMRELIEGCGCELVYLPPSEAPPDLNPKGEAFAKLKALLCAGPRCVPARLRWRRWAGRSTR